MNGNRSFHFRKRKVIAVLSIVGGVLIFLSPAVLYVTVSLYLIISGILELMAD